MSLTFTMLFDRIGRPTVGRGCIPGECRHVIATQDHAYALRAYLALLMLYGDQIEHHRVEATTDDGVTVLGLGDRP